MRILIKIFPVVLIAVLLSCAKGGPLTPADAFLEIRNCSVNNDRAGVLKSLSSESLKKIDTFIRLVAQLNENQIKILAAAENISTEKMKSLKPADCAVLYFNRNKKGINLTDIFSEDIIAVDVNGATAVVKTAGGFELDFVREGPYWKFDLSRL